MRLELKIPAVPVAQPRARAVNAGKHARMHSVQTIKAADGTRRPHPILAFKATVRIAASQAYTGPPLDCPVRIDCLFVMPRPKRLIWKTKPMPRVPHVTKPDRDNLDKAVLDALKGTILVDDCIAFAGTIEKWIAAGDEQPHAVITIVTFEPLDRNRGD